MKNEKFPKIKKYKKNALITKRTQGRERRERKRMSGNAKKLRILCMHGFYQNGSLFRNKTGSFRYLINFIN